ncbi:phosphatase 6 regulatory subunit 1-like protein fmt [Dermatophagoides pteronyssinus]|uniref:phosphatase 6 regulatory subunit 1-like protein fmt n=1 Tax=Dermatophagoides pteronyssinus TaxID=6956 RepID=UPI003F664C1F
MYWNDTTSRIDSILQEKDVTLEMILDEDDVLQECIGNNESLIRFLTKDEIIIKMLTMMTIEPESNDNEMENYKYANTICEILTHDGNLFSNLIATNRKYLLILWSFLDHSCRNEISVLSEQQQQQQEEQQKSTENEENLSIDKKEESNDENVDKNDNEKNEESGDKNEIDEIKDKETQSNNEDKVNGKSDNQEFETKNDEKQPLTTTTTNKESLNPLLASFFTKVFAYIFMHDTEPVLEFLITRNHPNDLVTVILKHIQTSAIMDFIYKTWKYINVDRYNQINQLTNEIKETLNGTTIIIKNDDDDNDKDNDDEQQHQQQQQQESSINLKFNNLLIENEFINKLIDMFQNPELESEQQNVAQLISDMIRLKREVLINAKQAQQEIMIKFDLESENTIKRLLNNMFECRTKNSIVNGLKIIQVLLQYNLEYQNMVTQQEAQLSSMIEKVSKKPSTDPMSDDDDDELEPMPKFLKQQSSLNVSRMFERVVEKIMDFPTEETQSEHLTQCVRNCSKALIERLEDFVAILIDSPYCEPMKTTAGIIEKPLGFIRLEVVHLFVALFATSDFQIMKKCSQLNVLKILTDQFFAYPLNNQLHKYYLQIICYIFQNYHNYKIIYDKHHQTPSNNMDNNDQTNDENQSNDQPNNNDDNKDKEKISYFLNRFEITKTLVEQILKDCHLIEKILDNFAEESIPIKSYELKNIDDKKQCSDQVDEKLESKENNQSSSNVDEQKKENVEDVIMEEQNESETKKSITDETIIVSKKPKLISRPGYMGHLRLIANTLNERCNENLLRECSLEEMLPQWKEFVKGKLEKLNQLITAELVPESKCNPLIDPILNEESEFLRYKDEEFTMTNMISEPKPLPDFSNQNLDINEALKLNNNIINDIEKFWENPSEDFESLEKYFECSTRNSQEINKKLANPDDIDDPWANDDSFNISSNDKQSTADEQWPKRSEFLIQECFASFDSNETNQKISDGIGLQNLEDYFTDIDVFNNSETMNISNTIEQQNPWGPTMQCSSSNSKIVNDEGWADFLNDPFASSPMVSIMNKPQQQQSKESLNNNENATTESTAAHVNDDSVDKSNNVEEDLFVANIKSSSSPTKNNENNDKEDSQMVANTSMNEDDPFNNSNE